MQWTEEPKHRRIHIRMGSERNAVVRTLSPNATGYSSGKTCQHGYLKGTSNPALTPSAITGCSPTSQWNTPFWGSGSKQATWRNPSGTLQKMARHKAASLHFLQSCQLFGRVLDEHSTDTTAPQLWGRVSRGTAPHGVA